MRKERDFYPTPPSLVASIPSLLSLVSPLPCEGGVGVDLGCGDGRLGRRLEETTPLRFRYWDLHPLLPAGEVWDLTQEIPPLPKRAELAISNPPFRHALRFVEVALSVAKRSFFLLPLSFLASKGRHAFWTHAPLGSVVVLSKRPSFSQNGRTDSADYAWFCFEEGQTLPPQIHWMDEGAC